MIRSRAMAPCEECGQLIPLAEMKCRYCGTEYVDEELSPPALGPWMSGCAFAGAVVTFVFIGGVVGALILGQALAGLTLLVLWLIAAVPCAVIGGLIAPRKGVDPQLATVACAVTTIVGVVYLVAMPEVAGWPGNGGTLTAGNASQRPQLWPCPRCATPIWSTSVFCPQCGVQLAPPPYPPRSGS